MIEIGMISTRELIDKINNNQLHRCAVEQLYLAELTIETFGQVIEALNDQLLAPFVKELELSFSTDAGIPDSIKSLVNLQAITVHKYVFNGPPLSCIPESLRNLPKLFALDLSGHNISIVPIWISELTELRSLNLSNNNISSLPLQMGNLINLRSLSLYRNPLTSIPRSITVLPHLDDLDIREIPLTNAPLSLFMNRKITRFCEPAEIYPDIALKTEKALIKNAIKFHLVFRIIREIPELCGICDLVAKIVKHNIWDIEFDEGNIYQDFHREYLNFARNKKFLLSEDDYLNNVFKSNISLISMFNVSWHEVDDHDPVEAANKYHIICWNID